MYFIIFVVVKIYTPACCTLYQLKPDNGSFVRRSLSATKRDFADYDKKRIRKQRYFIINRIYKTH